MSWSMSLFGQYGADNEPSSAINIPGAGTSKLSLLQDNSSNNTNSNSNSNNININNNNNNNNSSSSSGSSRPKLQDRMPESSFMPFSGVDDDVPFYMEDTEAPTQPQKQQQNQDLDEPRLNPFPFPSLVSIPK
ncbi:hypothetical protein PHYBLDRAFT_159370 [Phycomyces blakesleeanus NRRL 1555(-)]|uniref:Uncharacterized protein n=2 Tax=Phycomyces blakesleeanus TaxID=4837 RepID=A0A167LVG4_PHYB8|nr:hypothetical protein PHYBLDRAFT_159370 [Phycomyces blakesleeanus NRRL 1555(-)]OAD71176.1 hypothetical protein PHYBLDRAFT_159370 [Phycomyces blakesleeanus NRRL 1555(-)]|eukprot:XP_018289216.1 hypothetical protein PHYBLDRAFT_159370 [Phycomyces blakesleeanus NRRL 1555(-)]